MENEEIDDFKGDLDWEGFLARKHLNKSETARLIGAAPAMMTDWIKRKNYPSHKYLKALCMNGMTAQEMFGKEAGDALVKNSSAMATDELLGAREPIDYKNPQFQEAVQKALLYIDECKKRGEIK